MIRLVFLVMTMVVLSGCVQQSAPVTVDESTEAFVRRLIESGDGTATGF
jgi:hypothetical protein